jgi:hypothetical protein
MTKVTKKYMENWDEKIEDALAPIKSIEEKMLPLAEGLQCGRGLVEGIEAAFSQLYDAAFNLQGNLYLIEDEIDEFNSNTEYDLYLADDGSFYIGST